MERQVSSMFRKNKLYLSEDYNALATASLEANKALMAAQRDHPDLKVRNEQHDLAQERLMKALDDGAEDRHEIRDEYYQIRAALETAAGQIPAIIELREKSEVMSELVYQKKKELLLKTSSGKILISQIDANDKKIKVAQEQLQTAELKDKKDSL